MSFVEKIILQLLNFIGGEGGSLCMLTTLQIKLQALLNLF